MTKQLEMSVLELFRVASAAWAVAGKASYALGVAQAERVKASRAVRQARAEAKREARALRKVLEVTEKTRGRWLGSERRGRW
jgi:hypothetical protein